MRNKLWYRCAMCSPNQSRDANVNFDPDDLTLSEAYFLVSEEHKRANPKCPASTNSSATVEMLIRIVQ